MYRGLLIILVSSLLFSACVSNKKVQYVQYEDVNQSGLVKDSIVRNYEVKAYNYKIQPNDILSVDFQSLTNEDFDFFKKELSNNNTEIGNNNAGALLSGELVDDAGEIEFPVVGKVKVSGLTIFQAQVKLQEMADEFLKEVVVKVRILNFRFTILGEVKQEGTINSYDNRISILEAIGSAGGIDDLADRANVKMIRQTDSGIQIQYINLLDEGLINSPFYYIHQNDVLIIPPLKQRPFRKYAAQNAGLILSSISAILFAINLLK